jgi:hypothetical protein
MKTQDRKANLRKNRHKIPGTGCRQAEAAHEDNSIYQAADGKKERTGLIAKPKKLEMFDRLKEPGRCQPE